jgi:hypothetical protein
MTLAMVTLSALAFCASNSAAQAASSPPFTINPITARFSPTFFLTTYNATFSNAYGVPKAGVTFRWSYKLELVDKAGAPNPGVAGSGAAVDIGCTNNAVGIPHPVVSLLKSPANAYLVDFIWHHPDAANSEPPGRYHCNHLEEGPHGHQGLITLVVSDKTWECTATYKGTNSSLPFKKNENNLVNPNIRDGTASVPKCSRVR